MRGWLGGLLGLALVLSACAADESRSGPAVLVGGDLRGAAATAETSGTTTVLGSCVGAVSNGTTYVVVWPHGTDPASITVDATFAGGGGYYESRAHPLLPEIPDDCLAAATTDEVMWVQSLSEIRE